MKKNTIIRIVVTFLSSLFIVGLLYFIFINQNFRQNNFTRIFVPHPINSVKSLDLKYNSYYIAGASSHTIYLGNVTASLNLLKINTSLTDSQNIHLQVSNPEKINFNASQLIVDSPRFYIAEGTWPLILYGSLNDCQASFHIYDSVFFNTFAPISKVSFVLRSNSKNFHQYVLAKESLNAPHLTISPNLLKKQIDGLFCTDGMLLYNSDLATVVYVYYYRNEFICIDTNLNLLYKGKTIDTNSVAKIKLATVKSENYTTLSSPPLIVNKRSSTFGSWLFINSGITAKNESKELSKKNSVIDVYNLKNGQYKFSFYISDYNNNKIKMFRVYKDYLIALQGNYIVVYKLESKYFE